jgi:hypothetical protein
MFFASPSCLLSSIRHLRAIGMGLSSMGYYLMPFGFRRLIFRLCLVIAHPDIGLGYLGDKLSRRWKSTTASDH